MPWVFEYNVGYWVKYNDQQQNNFNSALIQGLQETRWLHTYNNGQKQKTTWYTIDFDKMFQINPDSHNERKIRGYCSEDKTKAFSLPLERANHCPVPVLDPEKHGPPSGSQASSSQPSSSQPDPLSSSPRPPMPSHPAPGPEQLAMNPESLRAVPKGSQAEETWLLASTAPAAFQHLKLSELVELQAAAGVVPLAPPASMRATSIIHSKNGYIMQFRGSISDDHEAGQPQQSVWHAEHWQYGQWQRAQWQPEQWQQSGWNSPYTAQVAASAPNQDSD